MGSSPSVAAATPGPAASICAEAGNTSEHTPYSLVRLCSAGGKFFSSSSTPASRAARCQDSMTDTATESTVNTWRKSNVVAPALMAARPCSSAAAALSTLSEVSDCRLSAWVDMAVFAGQLLYERSINLFGDGLQRLAGQRLVLGRQRLDQAVDAALGDFGREGALVGLHQPRAEHVDVIDLPTAGGLLDAVVELDGLAARHVHLRTHFDFGIAGVGAQRLEVDGFILDLRQRARVGEDQQRAELVLQRFLLVRRGGAPLATGRFGGHTLEVDVRQDLGLDQVHDFFLVAGLDRLVALGRVDHVLADTLDQHVRCFVAGRCGRLGVDRQRDGGKGDKLLDEFHIVIPCGRVFRITGWRRSQPVCPSLTLLRPKWRARLAQPLRSTPA